jgi:hypothetical protein
MTRPPPASAQPAPSPPKPASRPTKTPTCGTRQGLAGRANPPSFAVGRAFRDVRPGSGQLMPARDGGGPGPVFFGWFCSFQLAWLAAVRCATLRAMKSARRRAMLPSGSSRGLKIVTLQSTCSVAGEQAAEDVCGFLPGKAAWVAVVHGRHPGVIKDVDVEMHPEPVKSGLGERGQCGARSMTGGCGPGSVGSQRQRWPCCGCARREMVVVVQRPGSRPASHLRPPPAGSARPGRRARRDRVPLPAPGPAMRPHRSVRHPDAGSRRDRPARQAHTGPGGAGRAAVRA